MLARLSRKTFLFASVLSAAGGGCLLTTDLDGFTGDPTTTPAEGGAADGEVPPADGGTDTSTPGDAAADAPLDGGPPSPCEGTHAFCSDFDLDMPDLGWSSTDNTSPTGTLTFDPFARSAPRSMRTQQPRKNTAVQWMNTLHKKFEVSWRRTVVEGDVFLETPAWQTGDRNFSTIAVLMNSATQNTGTVFFIAETEAAATIQHVPDSPERYMGVDRIPYAAWTHVVIDFDPSGHIRYQIGTKSFDRDFTAATQGANPFLDIEIGAINFNTPVPAMDVRWDNFTVDFP